MDQRSHVQPLTKIVQIQNASRTANRLTLLPWQPVVGALTDVFVARCREQAAVCVWTGFIRSVHSSTFHPPDSAWELWLEEVLGPEPKFHLGLIGIQTIPPVWAVSSSFFVSAPLSHCPVLVGDTWLYCCRLAIRFPPAFCWLPFFFLIPPLSRSHFLSEPSLLLCLSL